MPHMPFAMCVRISVLSLLDDEHNLPEASKPAADDIVRRAKIGWTLPDVMRVIQREQYKLDGRRVAQVVRYGSSRQPRSTGGQFA